MIIKSEVEFNPSEINELFDNIIGIVAKVKLGMDMNQKVSDANHDKWKAEEELQRYEHRLEDSYKTIKALKAEIEKLKGTKKEENKKDDKDVKKDVADK